MKNLISMLALALILSACNQDPSSDPEQGPTLDTSSDEAFAASAKEMMDSVGDVKSELLAKAIAGEVMRQTWRGGKDKSPHELMNRYEGMTVDEIIVAHQVFIKEAESD